MKLKIKFAAPLLVIFLLFNCERNFAQWHMANGLEGGNIAGVFGIDSSLFAISVNRHLYTKFENSVSWELLNDNPSYNSYTKTRGCLFMNSSQEDDTCLRSFDCGLTWETVPNLSNASIMGTIDTTIFFFKNSKLYRSFDYGDNYEEVTYPNLYSGFRFFFDPNYFFIHRYDGMGRHKIFMSDDFGDTWDSIPGRGLFTIPWVDITMLKKLNGNFWVCIDSQSAPYSFNKLFVYNNDQSKWIEVSKNLPIYSDLEALTYFEGIMLCSYETYPVYRFDFCDSSWQVFDNNSKDINQFAVHNSKLYCATKQGVCLLDSLGNYTNFYQGYSHRNISSLTTLNDTIFITASNELFYSVDQGENYTRIENAWGKQFIPTDSVYYLITEHEFRISRDHGISWESHSDSIEHYLVQRINNLSIAINAYYLATRHGLFRSLTDTICWTKHGHGYIGPDYIIHRVEAINRTVFVNGSNVYWAYDLYFSNDFGNNFYLYDEYCTLMKVGEEYCIVKDSLYFSNFQAQEWYSIPYNQEINIDAIDKIGEIVCLGGRTGYFNDPNIEITFNSGNEWQSFINNIPFIKYTYAKHIDIGPLKFIKNRLFVGSPYNGLWYRDDILTNNPSIQVPNPNELKVKVYPNPCKDQVEFKMDITEASTIQIEIYNPYGLAVLQTEARKYPAGQTSVQVNLPESASGLYFFQVKINKQNYGGKFIRE